MNRTKWWKCDLQVATPAWEFRLPAGTNYQFDVLDERTRFLDEYMRAVRTAGIDVIALADHNTGAWIDEAKAAGKRHGVVVFPGCEITTHTGADGVHLIIIGDLDKTSQDFDRLIHGPLGFDYEHPPFRVSGGGVRDPGSSGKTLTQILDALPDGYLAIAPHAFNENGVASAKTVKGDMRWRALHHERLVAVDPGNCADTGGESFNSRFRRRELVDFPRLRDLAFVATSDAYSLDQIGQRFSWIRMAEPTIEALRQACLDHESRILCDWSPNLANFPERNPNNVRHAWISSVKLEGTLGNSTSPLSVSLHPNMNVLIGGRGSGKSSVIAALRQLYSSTETLPKRLREEAEEFAHTVFGLAQLRATHRVQESQEEQHVEWAKDEGSVTPINGQRVPTSFPVTVISQKELFERAAGDKNDPCLSSRSLLALVDGSIGFDSTDARAVDSFGRQLEDARVGWSKEVRDFVHMTGDLAQLPALRQQAAVLQGQVDAFASPEVKQRLSRIEARQQESARLSTERQEVIGVVEEVKRIAEQLQQLPADDAGAAEPFTEEYAALINLLRDTTSGLAAALNQACELTESAILAFDKKQVETNWNADVMASQQDLDAYKLELHEKGLSTSEFSRLQDELIKVREIIRRLEEKEPQLDVALGRLTASWKTILDLVNQRRNARQALMDVVHQRSGRLRFKVTHLADTSPWVESLRSMSGFRTDAYLDDVPQLASWLWNGAVDGMDDRWSVWRDALATGDLSDIQRLAKLRVAFADRLANIEETVRLRLASLFPDDVVSMEFLREDGNPAIDEDWQSVTQGSPGQRTAAMLAFVLHHGREPLVLDQPEDDLDSEWISKLVVKELRQSRWHRQLIVVSHNANIPVLGDAEQVIALENKTGALSIRSTAEPALDGAIHLKQHVGPVEDPRVRNDIQAIMEGGILAFVRREQKYNNETRLLKTNG